MNTKTSTMHMRSNVIGTVLCALLWVCGAARGAAPVVTSVTAAQQAQPSTVVDIHYTVTDADSSTVAVMVDVSTNAGATYDIRASNCSGDVGDAVSVGAGKHITWDAHYDLPQFVSEQVRVKVWAFDSTLSVAADPDVEVRAAWRGADPAIVLEWDLQSMGAVDNLRYSAFGCSAASITAAQYCRFLNAWKDRFAVKSAPACTVTGVMNTAQGGPWLEVHHPGTWQLCAIRSTPNNDDSNAYSKIMWDGAAYSFNSTGSETNEPMTEVSWYGAVAYCQWLNETQFGANTANWQYRLPTEWEYEFLMGARSYSMRGATQDWGSATYTYGQASDTLSRTAGASDYINYAATAWQGTVASGGKGGPGANARNVFGMYELSGNVCAWCLDWYTGAPAVAGQNYVNRAQGSAVTRSARGGHWTFADTLCSAGGYRWAGNPSALNSRVGFVVVREL